MRSLTDELSTVRRSASSLYADGQEIWSKDDRWNQHKRNKIERFIQDTDTFSGTILEVLDAGSGNSLYEWMPANRVSADRFYHQVKGKTNSVVCDLETLPFRDGSFNLVFCIGSVLNYVSALEAISELSRITAIGGRLYLHFETSSSFEQIGRPVWNAPAYLNKTINSSRPDSIWIYSPSFIYRALATADLRILKRDRFHILSAFLTRFGISQNRAAWAGNLDTLASWLGMFADDVIVLAEKI